jgi:hypothetical protein
MFSTAPVCSQPEGIPFESCSSKPGFIKAIDSETGRGTSIDGVSSTVGSVSGVAIKGLGSNVGLTGLDSGSIAVVGVSEPGDVARGPGEVHPTMALADNKITIRMVQMGILLLSIETDPCWQRLCIFERSKQAQVLLPFNIK